MTERERIIEFGMWLTARDKTIKAGASEPVYDMIEALNEFLNLSALTPQATTVGVTDDMVDAALNASWGEDGRPIWSFINDEHPHALMTTALKAALIGIPGAEKGEAVAWEDVPADIQELAKTIAPGAPRYHFAICCAIIEARRAAPTSERVQVLEEAAKTVETSMRAHYFAQHGIERGLSEAEMFFARAIRALKATP